MRHSGSLVAQNDVTEQLWQVNSLGVYTVGRLDQLRCSLRVALRSVELHPIMVAQQAVIRGGGQLLLQDAQVPVLFVFGFDLLMEIPVMDNDQIFGDLIPGVAVSLKNNVYNLLVNGSPEPVIGPVPEQAKYQVRAGFDPSFFTKVVDDPYKIPFDIIAGGDPAQNIPAFPGKFLVGVQKENPVSGGVFQ